MFLEHTCYFLPFLWIIVAISKIVDARNQAENIQCKRETTEKKNLKNYVSNKIGYHLSFYQFYHLPV